jgi:hypothetical protein
VNFLPNLEKKFSSETLSNLLETTFKQILMI